MRRRHRILAAAGALALCLSLAACSSPPVGGSSGSADGGGAAQSESQASDSRRQVVTTADVSLAAGDPVAAADAVAAVAIDAGGRVDARTETPDTNGQMPSAQLTLRIPSDKLDAALDDIAAAGALVSLSMSHDDVTDSTRDLDARITALQTSVDRLLELMASANDTSDLLAIEEALSARQADLDSLKAQRDDIASRVDLSTVTVSIATPGSIPRSAPSNFWEAIVVGVESIGSVATAIVIVLGVLLPWLLLAAVVIALVLLLRRRARRRAPDGPDGPSLVPPSPAGGPRGGRSSYIPPAPPLPTDTRVSPSAPTAQESGDVEPHEPRSDEEEPK